MSDADYEYDHEPDGIVCPRCSGGGSVDCYCAGDFCCCSNHGERDCPTCGGDGEVSEQVEEQYLENERQMHAAFTAVWSKPNDR